MGHINEFMKYCLLLSTYFYYSQEHSNSDSDSVIIEDDSSEDEAPQQQSPVLGQEASLSDIDRLRIEKERLTRKLQTQQQTQQDIEVLVATHPMWVVMLSVQLNFF